MKAFQNNLGQSLMEIVLAIAVFGLFAAAISTYVLGGLTGQQTGADHIQAELLAQQGIEAVRSIRDRAFNELTLAQSGVQNVADEWEFLGEGSTETIGKFTRTIVFSAVCRNSSHDIVSCPGAYTDPHSKQVTVTISWLARPGVTDTVTQTTFLNNWRGRDWTQTDWSGGAGQAIWLDASKYDSDDTGVSGTTTPGELQLAPAGGGTWAVFGSESFDTSDTDFNQGTFVNTQVTSTGVNASVILTQATAAWSLDAQSGTVTTQTLNALSIISSNNIWAAGGSGKILYFNGTTWVEYVDTGNMTWYDMKMVSDLDGWVVGTQGNIYHYVDATNDSTVNGSWSSVTSGTNQQLNAIYAVSASDVWAVGNSGKIMHYNGTSWSEFADTGNNTWKGIHMVSATDGWIVGNSGEIRRYNGTNWNTSYASGVSNLNSVHFVSANDGWAAGSTGKILHWNGTAWSEYVDTGAQTWNSVYMVSATEGWVAGSGGVLYRYIDNTNDSTVNGTWSSVTSPTANALNAIKMSGSLSGWAVGASGTIIKYSAGYNTSGTYYSRIIDGGAQPTNWKLLVWTEILPAGSDITIAVRTGTTPTPDGSWSAFGSEQTNPLGSNITGASARYLQYRVTFTLGTDPSQTPQLDDVNLVINRSSTQQLNAVDVLSTTEAWAVGGGGVIEFYDGIDWDTVISPAGNTMNGLDMLSSSEGWAAGANGKIWKYNGTSWSEFVDTGNENWQSISMVDSNDGFVVDLNGVIRRFNGAAWNLVATPGGVTSLYSVHAISSSLAWAAGGAGKILYWNGASWIVYATTAGAETWRSITMITSLQGWVVGDGGKIYRYVDPTNDSLVNGTWSSVSSPTTNNLNGVSLTSTTNGWAIGNGGVILKWDGVSWVTSTTPTLLDLLGIKMYTAQLGWAVGKNGIILQFIGGNNFVNSGTLTSSAFDTGAISSFGVVEWDQTMPSCTPACAVQLQVRTAPDNGGVPGTWTSWYGAGGADTYYTLNTGTLLPSIFNGNRWIQYRVNLSGDGILTPAIQEIRVDYQNY